MGEEYEHVHEVVDDYHGPRSGFADYRGAPHWFCALAWEARPEEGGAKPDNSGYDPKDDRYYLVPVTAPNGNRIFATGTFRPRQAEPDCRAGSQPSLEVLWRPYGCLVIP